MRERSKSILKAAAVLLLWLVIWQLVAQIINQAILIPTPYDTLKSLIRLCKTGEFYLSALLSLLRIISGYVLGIIAGILGALLSHRFKLFKAVFSPILNIIKAVPVASFIILALVWFRSATLPVFISFLMVLPMIWSTVETGLCNINKEFLEIAQVYKITPVKVFFQIKIPLILPALISTALTALGFSWKSGIAAEVISRPDNSLGNLLQESKLYIATDDVFALTVVVALLSLLLEKLIRYIVGRYTDDKY